MSLRPFGCSFRQNPPRGISPLLIRASSRSRRSFFSGRLSRSQREAARSLRILWSGPDFPASFRPPQGSGLCRKAGRTEPDRLSRRIPCALCTSCSPCGTFFRRHRSGFRRVPTRRPQCASHRRSFFPAQKPFPGTPCEARRNGAFRIFPLSYRRELPRCLFRRISATVRRGSRPWASSRTLGESPCRKEILCAPQSVRT